MNDYIKALIGINKDAIDDIAMLEGVVKEYSITDEKSKANFGNICILLNGYRNIANAQNVF